MAQQTKINRPAEEPKKKLPVLKVKAGNVETSLWENISPASKDRAEQKYYNFEFKRSYKDKEGNWQDTTSFTKHDIVKIEVCLNKVKEFLFLSRPKEPDQEEIPYD